MASLSRPGAWILGLWAFLAWSAVWAAPAPGTLDPREVQARGLFAAGKYEDALNTYATLFGETGDPIHLRNVARCYQKLRQPDAAIDRFQEYLRKVPAMTAAERTEIDGYIREMEALRAEQARQRTSAPAATSPPPPRSEVSLAAPPPPVESPMLQATAPMADAPPPGRPIYKRAWFWGAIGAVVLAGVVIGVVATRPGEQPCPASDYVCP